MDDVQSWWEVPCIAHFCSLFRSSFDLLDFDIEELEEALLTHTVEEVGSSLIQELIVRLLKGCFNSSKDEITTSNYQMYLRRLFRIKCEEDEKRKNPFDLDVAFHSLPLRTKVEILYDLCDFRLDGDEVQETLKSLESHSLRVTPLGKDSGGSTYWYFYGTRLYREDYSTPPQRGKRSKHLIGNGLESLVGSKWQVVCFTEEDWHLLTSKFKNCRSKNERSLHQTLKEDFLPELPRLFAEKEKMQRKRMLEQQLRRSNRSSASVNSGDDGRLIDESHENADEDELRRQRLEQEKADRLLAEELFREERQARIRLRDRRGGGVSGSVNNDFSSGNSDKPNHETKAAKRERRSSAKEVKKKRMTNNSMAACLTVEGDTESLNDGNTSANEDSPVLGKDDPKPKLSTSTKAKKTGEVKKDRDSKENKIKNKHKTKVKSSALFSQSDEDIIIGMHKVIEAVKNHRDAWPFVNPVDEEYAPNYYRVITSPMDVITMEDKLDNHEYSTLQDFKDDFQKIVDNCKKYNGITSEYTEMVETVLEAFNKAVRRYILPDESDEEMTIEFNHEHKKSKKSVSKHKKSKKITEHKKENEPTSAKSSKRKLEKAEKKRRNKELMRHHARNSASMDALNTATAETLKDINTWLSDSPKAPDYSSSISNGFEESGNVDNVINSDLEKAVKKSLKELKKNRSRHSVEKPNSSAKKSDKISSKQKREKIHKNRSKSRDKDGLKTKEGKSKHHHNHKRHRHEDRSSSSGSKISNYRSPSPEGGMLLCEPKAKKVKVTKEHKSKGYNGSFSPKKQSKSLKSVSDDATTTVHSEKMKSRSPVKKSSPKFSLGKKRFQLSKNHKTVSLSQESKKYMNEIPSASSVYDFGSYKSSINSNEGPTTHLGAYGQMKDMQDKKRCLLIIDSPKDSEGGPKLSLGSVLASDDIKLGDFKNEEQDDDEDIFPKTSKLAKDRFDDLKEKTHGKDVLAEKSSPSRSPVKPAEEEAKTDDENEETDRKLEPSKGFNRDKSLPNLSAWIKAFGGPTKNTGASAPGSKKPDADPKSKFKVLGRSSEGTEEKSKYGSRHGTTGKLIPHQQLVSPPLKSFSGSHNCVDEALPNHGINEHHDQNSTSYKRHRSRKHSCSSISSQSESGSPSCFQGHNEDVNSRMAINPPRWVDEHWGPSQSPASSHVSSQSPAGPNSPFSPSASSPPRTPQTPPWPPAPVRVGFYQDLTLQHPSPDKSTESNSNVSSPNPGSSMSVNTRPRSRENTGRDGYQYSGPGYTNRQNENVASPSLNSASDMPSPAMNISVDSPGNRSGSMGSADSPQSPSNPIPAPQVADRIRPAHSKRSESPGTAHYQLSHSRMSIPFSSQDQQMASSNTIRSASHSVTAMNLNVNANLNAPIPMVSSASKPSYIEPGGNSVYDNPHAGNQQPAHSGPKFPAPAHRQPSGISHDHPGMSPVSNPSMIPNHGVIVSGISSTGLPTNLTSHVSQSATFTTAAYSQSYKGMLSVPGSGASISSDGRFSYKGALASNIMSASVTHAAVTPSSRSRKSASALAAAANSSKGGSPLAVVGSPVPGVSPDVAVLEGKLGPDINVNGLQWPHNLASLTQIVNSIPNPMALGAPGLPNAYRAHFDANVANAVENMAKYQRFEYNAAVNASGKSGGTNLSDPQVNVSEKSPQGDAGNDRRSSKTDSKTARGQGSGKGGGPPISTGGTFNFPGLPPDIAMYSKEMSESGGLYGSSSPAIAHHRSDLYPTSTTNFHPAFATSAAKTTAAGMPAASIPPYQIPPFIGSHPSPYQPQSVSSQPSPFSHSQSSRGIVDPYQQFFPGSPHVMGLLPPTSYAAPFTHPHHSLGFNRPGWI